MSLAFGAYMRDLRASRGMSLRQLADRLENSHSFLHKVESGKLQPSASLLEKLSGAFGTDRDELWAAAGRVAPDLVEALCHRPVLIRLARTASRMDAVAVDVLVDELEQLA